jgi:hypothetical protein
MKKIGNRPITEADTDFSKQQKNKKIIKKKKKIGKLFGNFSGFFSPFFLLLSYVFLTKKYVITFSTS